MNREIKFRGLRTDGKGWVYGGYFQHTPDEDGVRYYIFDFNEGAVEVKRETVGQFTGLLDQNGVEIYEGDIITNGSYDYVISYTDSRFCGMGRDKHAGFYQFISGTNRAVELIGNIHEKGASSE